MLFKKVMTYTYPLKVAQSVAKQALNQAFELLENE